MANGKKSASYLNSRLFAFTAEDWSTWGFRIFVLLALSAIGLVYLLLILAYLAMACEDKVLSGSKPAWLEIHEQGLSLPQSEQKSYFFKGKEAVTLLVVSGLVRNNYPEARRHIKLRGKIVSAEGRILADSIVYAGNVINKKDLARLPLSEILIRLSDKSDRIKSVPPNGLIAFMMVFDNPPQGPYEYQIEAVNSDPLDGTYGAADEK